MTAEPDAPTDPAAVPSPAPTPLAVLAVARTPFVRAFNAFQRVSALSLGTAAAGAAIGRAGLGVEEIDEVIFGNVAGPPDASNIARVISLKAGLPHRSVAHTVNRNCGSGLEALVSAGAALAEGRAELVVAGGVESMSNVPLLFPAEMTRWLLGQSRRRRWWQKLAGLASFRPRFLRPVPALELGLTDPDCGLTMGQTAEVLARDFSIERDQQDAFALASHQRAVAAAADGFFDEEIVPIDVKGQRVAADIGPREGQSMEALAKLRPVFEPGSGSVTVGNSCPITDGAAAVVLARPETAFRRGIQPLGYITGWAIAGCEPARMGLGPVHATARLLEQTGQALDDFDLVELNEAFAAQVLACQAAMASESFAREELGRERPLGTIPPDRLNVHGGAIALGHPVGATGARLVLTLLRALRVRGGSRGLATLCIGGGQGAALSVSTEAGE